jgi:hypothetical protein
MNKKKVLPVVLIGSMVGESLMSARHFDSGAPQPHIEFEITLPFVSPVSTVTAGMASVVYVSSGFMDKNVRRSGQMTEAKMFPSVEDAMRGPFPTGYESAYLRAEVGRYAFHPPRFGWERC